MQTRFDAVVDRNRLLQSHFGREHIKLSQRAVGNTSDGISCIQTLPQDQTVEDHFRVAEIGGYAVGIKVMKRDNNGKERDTYRHAGGSGIR